MKICFMCDLHLPFDKEALQYRVLDWAVEDIIKNKPDCIAFAGDATCDGNIEVYKNFLSWMSNIGMNFLYIPGNSDLRNNGSCREIHGLASSCKNRVCDTVIFAINDSDSSVNDVTVRALEEADCNSVVFMHHPINNLKNESREKLLDWRKRHNDTKLFFGHCHCSENFDNDISLGAMDPDKAIGENPCITYYDTKTKELQKSFYSCPLPYDFSENFGISCYRLFDDISFATENKLRNLELRQNCVNVDREKLLEYIVKWREAGGRYLSLHLPDVLYVNGKVAANKNFDKCLSLAKFLKVNRFTEHVPLVSVKDAREDGLSLEKIADFLSERFNSFDYDITIGIENMHMTSSEKDDDSRRYGYIPEECIEFAQLLQTKCKHRVGINFDIGHARNNMPFSQKYQTSTWLSMIGKYAVGYHIHQVIIQNGTFENHMPITNVYGGLISYASFFKYWEENRINKAPLILEMRPDGAYKTTLETFNYMDKKALE